MKTVKAWEHGGVAKAQIADCHCALCGLPIMVGQAISDQHVLEADGSLDYISLAHTWCVRMEEGQ